MAKPYVDDKYGKLLPGEIPSHYSKADVKQIMDMEQRQQKLTAGYGTCEVRMIENSGSRESRKREPRLLVTSAARPLRPEAQAGIYVHKGNEVVIFENPIKRAVYPGLQIDSPHDLCAACCDALDHFCQWVYVCEIDNDKIKEWSNCVVHHFSPLSLSVSSNFYKCPLCQVLQQTITTLYPGSRALGATDPPFRIEMCWSITTRRGKAQLDFNLASIEKPRGRFNPSAIMSFDVFPSEEYASTFDHPFPIDDAGDYQSTINSATSGKLGQHWLSRCVNNADGHHTSCQIEAASQLPTRLLDVKGARETGRLRLVVHKESPELFGEDVKYITLSHCWGGQQGPRLVSTNYAERRDVGLAIEELPKTFRDAVEVTNWHDVDWLWIDCLCIIQDQESDWEREAMMMPSIYRHALFNISADSALSSDDGFLKSRTSSKMTPISITSRTLGQSWRLMPQSQYYAFQIQLAETTCRAWIYSERQLSRRILHFGTNEMWWECCASHPNSCFASDMFPGGAPLDFVLESSFKSKVVALEQQDGTERQGEMFDTWNDMCEIMSTRNLTVPTDMPIILSSLAEDFAKIFELDGSFVGGLWASTLPGCLMWRRCLGNTRQSQQPFIAPSWSWLSLGVPIEMQQNSRLNGRIKFSVAVAEAAHLKEKYSSYRYGPLSRGVLRMQGYLRKIRFEFPQPGDDTRATLYVYDTESASKPRKVGPSWHEFDGNLFRIRRDDATAVGHLDCWCMLIDITQSRRDSLEQDIDALLLHPEQIGQTTTGRWKRIGVMTLLTDAGLKMRYKVLKSKSLLGSMSEGDWKSMKYEMNEQQKVNMGWLRAFQQQQQQKPAAEESDNPSPGSGWHPAPRPKSVSTRLSEWKWEQTRRFSKAIKDNKDAQSSVEEQTRTRSTKNQEEASTRRAAFAAVEKILRAAPDTELLYWFDDGVQSKHLERLTPQLVEIV